MYEYNINLEWGDVFTVKRYMYRKDTEPLYHAFMYSPNTSFQYLSIHAMSVIAGYNYQKRLKTAEKK